MSELANCIIIVTRINLIVSAFSVVGLLLVFLQREYIEFAFAHGCPEYKFSTVLWIISCFSFQVWTK